MITNINNITVYFTRVSLARASNDTSVDKKGEKADFRSLRCNIAEMVGDMT